MSRVIRSGPDDSRPDRRRDFGFGIMRRAQPRRRPPPRHRGFRPTFRRGTTPARSATGDTEAHPARRPHEVRRHCPRAEPRGAGSGQPGGDRGSGTGPVRSTGRSRLRDDRAGWVFGDRPLLPPGGSLAPTDRRRTPHSQHCRRTDDQALGDPEAPLLASIGSAADSARVEAACLGRSPPHPRGLSAGSVPRAGQVGRHRHVASGATQPPPVPVRDGHDRARSGGGDRLCVAG